MNNLVFVGGFGAGKMQAEKCAHELGRQLNVDDVHSTTFSDSRRNPDRLLHWLQRTNFAASHSAGALSLAEHVVPTEYFFINAPMRRSRSHIVSRGGLIGVNMTMEAIRDPYLVEPSIAFMAGYVADIGLHPVSNFEPLYNGEISNFDSSKVLPRLVSAGNLVHDVRTLNDEYFELTHGEVVALDRSDVDTVMLDGFHNTFLVDTNLVSREITENISR